MKRSLALIALSLAAALAGCSGSHAADPAQTRVSLMTWNVENLFDTTHDAGKEDIAYLPLAEKRAHPEYMAVCERIRVEAWRRECEELDWTPKLLDEKLERLAAVIEQIDDGRGPDVLILEEVENKAVLEQLNARLSKAGYGTRVLLEGWDARGIDTAVLSRLPQWGAPILHKVPYQAEGDRPQSSVGKTRGMLEVRLTLPGGQKASVFAVHLPSGGSPGYLRQQAIAQLATLKAQLPADVLPIVGGDFNINAGEEAKAHYIGHDLASTWVVSHLIGCQDCKGSYYYHSARQWSFFDILLFPKELTRAAGFAGWKLDPASIRLANDSRYQTNRWGTPSRFSMAQYDDGVSDHWPMYAEIYHSPVEAQ